MLASTLLITLHGPFQRLDLELPGDVAISELLPLLLEMSGSQRKDPQILRPTNAHLYVAGMYTPLPLHETLIDAGVCSGTELELHTQEWHKTPLSSVAPQQFGLRPVPSGIDTGGIGITWESLL
jgi:WXG100 protein secretion system (Wss), protein YukD